MTFRRKFMSQITTAAITTTIPAPAVSQPATANTPAQQQFTRTVASAVRQLNESDYVGEGREVQFSIDRTTRLPVVKVVDTATKEVINQWPPEYALQLAESNNTRDSG